MSKARDLANAGTALGAVTATELGYVDGVTSAIQTQIDTKEATLPSQTGNSGKYLTTDGSAKSWGTVSQYALPSQTGNSGKYLTTNGTAESWGTVTTPITWTQRTVMDASPNMIEYNGSNLWVAVGSGGKISTSPDGATWTARTSGTANVLVDVAYGNGLWVAVGYNGTLVTSSDGTTWTVRTSNTALDLYGVHYANSVWVAVGAGGGTLNTGGIVYSTDGTTWTRKSQSLTVGTDYNDVIWNGTNWIVSAGHSTNNYLYASTPSGTWTAGASGTGQPLYQLFYDGTRTIVISTGGIVGFSTSATLGTTTTLSGVTPIANAITNKVYYYNGEIYYIGIGFSRFSTTPLSGNFARFTAGLSIPPSTFMDSTGVWSDNGRSIWVGAAGIIIAASNPGQIFTSF
jgi:hypothetical protein